jgi:2-methylcitrate dehydratase PrpD
VLALRAKVAPTVHPSIAPAQVLLEITLSDGRTLRKRIEHAVGSVERPLSDSALEAKFTDLAEGILPQQQVRHLLELCWSVESLPSAAAIAEAAVPI